MDRHPPYNPKPYADVRSREADFAAVYIGNPCACCGKSICHCRKLCGTAGWPNKYLCGTASCTSKTVWSLLRLYEANSLRHALLLVLGVRSRRNRQGGGRGGHRWQLRRWFRCTGHNICAIELIAALANGTSLTPEGHAVGWTSPPPKSGVDDLLYSPRVPPSAGEPAGGLGWGGSAIPLSTSTLSPVHLPSSSSFSTLNELCGLSAATPRI